VVSGVRQKTGQAVGVALLMLLFFATPAFSANVVATVDRNQVGANESFRLSFEADDAVGSPDFSVLEEHFEVLDKSQNQSISIVNGQTSRKYVWDLVLMAQTEGIFQIPPISFGGVFSQPISIVVKAGSDVAQTDKSLYLDVEVDVDQPYVQQQVIYTVRLFRSVDIASATLSELAVEGVDAIVEPFGDDKNYQTVRNGQRWLVVERKYLVFPQQSGYLTIRPLEFRGQIVERRSSLGLFGQPSGRPVVLRSESVTIAVREPPASFAGPWLPAKRLELTETWPENQTITVGEPVTRGIAVTALGLTAAQVPEIRTGLPDGLRAYPEQPALEDTGHDQGVQGSRVESMAIIPTRAGPVTLPEIKVAWWNVDAGQPEIATIPPRTIDVMGAPATTASSDAALLPAPPPDSAEPEDSSDAEVSQWQGWWPWSTLALALAWIATLVLWVFDRRRSRKPAETTRPGRPIADPGPALSEFDRACAADDAQQAKDALLKWGEALWPETPPNNLGHLAARCGEPLATQVVELERHLYGKSGTWNPDGMTARLRGFKRTDNSASGGSGLSLEPMYRTP